jgi:hypothetical protein
MPGRFHERAAGMTVTGLGQPRELAGWCWSLAVLDE